MRDVSYNPQDELTRIETIGEMFSTEAWAMYLQDMQQNLDAVNSLSGIVGEQQLGIRQGQVDTLSGILNYENLITATEAQIRADMLTPESSDPDA